jgi:membrane associated rhomboid family serine protease
VLPLRDNVPTRSFPVVTISLIIANGLVFVWEVAGTPLEHDVFRYGYYPCSLDPPCIPPAPLHYLPWYLGALASMFMHGGLLHLAGNMLFLWIFGNNVEDALGSVRFLLWYIAGGIAATALQTWVTLDFAGPEQASIPNVGASGAIAAVLGAYLVLLPGAKVLTLVGWFLVEIPAVVFLGIWFVFQLWQGNYAVTHPEAGGGVAFFAHIGGFLYGMLTAYLVAKRRPLGPSY